MTLSDHYQAALKADESHPILDELDAEIHEPMSNEREKDMTRDDLVELKRLIRCATPLPWAAGGHKVREAVGPRLICHLESTTGSTESETANGKLIVTACNALPGLIAEIERLRALVHPAPATAETSGAMADFETLLFDFAIDAGRIHPSAFFAGAKVGRNGEALRRFVQRLIPAPAAAPDGGQKCKNPWCVDGKYDVIDCDGETHKGVNCPDCTPAREAKCVCNRGKIILNSIICKSPHYFDSGMPLSYCVNCGHFRACHADEVKP